MTIDPILTHIRGLVDGVVGAGRCHIGRRFWKSRPDLLLAARDAAIGDLLHVWTVRRATVEESPYALQTSQATVAVVLEGWYEAADPGTGTTDPTEAALSAEEEAVRAAVRACGNIQGGSLAAHSGLPQCAGWELKTYAGVECWWCELRVEVSEVLDFVLVDGPTPPVPPVPTAGVSSLAVAGEAELDGDITLSAAGGVVLTQAGQDIEIGVDLSGLVADDDPRLSDARTPTAHTHGKADLTDATATPTGDKIPIADGAGKVDGWVTSGAVAATPSLRALGTGATEACAGDDGRLTDAREATGLKTTGATVVLTAGAPPEAGQVLTAGSAVAASWATPAPAPTQEDLIGVSLDGSGAVLVAGSKGHREVAWACAILGWTLLADVAGSVVVDVRACSYAAWPTTVTICGGVYPSLAAAQKGQAAAGGCVGVSLAAGDVLEFVVTGTPVTVTKAWLFLRVRRS